MTNKAALSRMHCEVGERLFLFDFIYLQIPPSGNVSRKQNQRALVAPTGGNDIRDTQYPGSTTQRHNERDRGPRGCFWAIPRAGMRGGIAMAFRILHTISMDSAKISGMQQQTMHWEGGFFKPGFID